MIIMKHESIYNDTRDFNHPNFTRSFKATSSPSQVIGIIKSDSLHNKRKWMQTNDFEMHC